ncbi:MAG: GAF domain-containing protein [Candidatus Mcinerneyibacterium aminivorans]|uniref:GAF domain-containing protein n=1 Tax=Candidatus Mcinerneyibacterium aminivorans TaxID=2703815 RepID=A0A5D0MG22_9BACT|nr:MAG: GAF domain-containing protein [Candidatus Mcinerneyibacterium aminivorans]
MNYNITEFNFNIPKAIRDKWQDILNIMAQIIDVPAALIMKVELPDIKVYLSSDVENNPYTPGDSEVLIDSGLYCETVIKKREKLKVPNALEDEEWKNNPDVDLNMISYLGFPIIAPDNKVFGTLCVLDNKTNNYSKLYEKLIKKFKESIESDLQLLKKNHLIREKNKKLNKYISEIKELKGIIPICSNCHKIRDNDGYWQRVEKYIQTHSNAQFSHGVCPECRSKLYPELD